METKNLIVINIIVVVAVLGLVSLLSVNGARNRAEDRIDTLSTVLTDDEMGEAFIDGCVEEGAPKSYCTCAYNYLDSRINDREMMQLAFDLADGEIPDIMIDAVSECLYLFEY